MTAAKRGPASCQHVLTWSMDWRNTNEDPRTTLDRKIHRPYHVASTKLEDHARTTSQSPGLSVSLMSTESRPANTLTLNLSGVLKAVGIQSLSPRARKLCKPLPSATWPHLRRYWSTYSDTEPNETSHKTCETASILLNINTFIEDKLEQ
jgi:hypothetical protein